ncbi:hypothetical protein J2X71_006265 [Rhizobium sp. 1399]|nr:hypothetical protein [Rhizobium sp. 1399]
MHACPLERSDITIIKAFGHGAPSWRIAALSAVSDGVSHRSVTCFQPAETPAILAPNGWSS